MARRVTTMPRLQAAPREAHKGLFGKVLIVGGSGGMIGAPACAANAALRSGAGLVRLGLPRRVQLAAAALAPCATSLPLPDDDEGRISAAALTALLAAAEENDAVAVGPGLGRSNELQGVVLKLAGLGGQGGKRVVIDADGLNNLAAATTGGEAGLSGETVLTPHPGEMARLWRAWFRAPLPQARQEQAEQLSRRCGAVVALKGAETVVTDGEQTYVNETGNPGMATAGAGDVLTGMIAALLARQEGVGRLSALEATILAVHVHGLAGDAAAAALGELSVTATDLIDYLPEAWRRVRS